MRPIVRGAAAVLAAPALLLPALVATATPASAAVDPAPAEAGAAWLTSQLSDGLIVGAYDAGSGPVTYDDYGLTIDAAYALAAVGETAPLAGITAALAAHVDDYTRGDQFAPTHVYAGALGKLSSVVQLVGQDPTDFGGQDLIERLEERVITEGPSAGRIQDVVDPGSVWPGDAYEGDTAGVISQGWAVRALDAAGSDLTDSATDFLLEQQCEAGFFRVYLNADEDAADQSCDGGAVDAEGNDASPSVDATALAVMSLASQRDDTDVLPALTSAVTWLAGQQGPDGSFTDGTATGKPNTNSTGIAGWVLGEAGLTAAAEKAAAWVRAHQAVNLANCVYFAAPDTGAIAFDDDALGSLQSAPLTQLTADQTRRATTQALPVLQWAQDGEGDPQALFAPEYVKAGGLKPVGVTGAAPGEALCAMLGEQSVLGYADLAGEADLRVRIPARTGTSEVSVANTDGAFGTVEINALGKQKLQVTVAKKKVAKGAKQSVTVRKLAPGETTSLKVGKTTIEGQANGKGVVRVTFTVSNKPGAKTLKVTGAFPNRTGSVKFTVTR